MILSFWNFVRGFLLIEISGFSIERFMNLAVNKNIYLWDINYEANKVKMKVSIKGYKSLRYCAKKTKCKIKILDKRGLPFIFFKYRKRKILLFGFIAFVGLLYFLSSYIWAIEITGTEQIKEYEIKEFLKNKNIGNGTKKSHINTIVLEEQLLKEFDILSWVNVQSVGTTLNINASEILEQKEFNMQNEPSNLIAKKDGLITYIAVNNGLGNVKAYDVVKKGDILITGEVFLKEDENGKHFRYTYASGEVKAKVYYDMNFFIPYEYEEYEYTGNTKNRYTLVLGDNKINLYFNRNFYNDYDIINENKQMKFGENYRTPVVLKKEIFLERELISKNRDFEQCKQYATTIINEKLVTEFDINIDIVKKNIDFLEKDDGIEVVVEISTIENIGEEQLINFDENLIQEVGDINENGQN